MSVPINPETRVGALLEAYPGIDEQLIAWVPAFARLRNPILRKTVTKVVTLEQAARVGGIPLRDLLERLREATGQSGETMPPGGPEPSNAPAPEWVQRSRVAHEIDANALIGAGEHPLGKVRQCVANLAPGETVRIISSFHPAPLIDVMQRGGLAVYSAQAEPDRHLTYISREAA